MTVLEQKKSQKRLHYYFFSILVSLLMILCGMVVFVPDVESKQGGPDSHGYRWIDTNTPTPSIAYNWTDGVTGGTEITLGNDQNSGFISLGFNFPYYSQYYSQIAVCSNGWLSIIHSTYTSTTGTIPSSSNPDGVIAPFWMNLDPSANGKVYYKRNLTSPKHFIVTWEAVSIYAPIPGPYDYNNTFQAILFENGTILFQYQSINFTGYPVVGIEDINGYVGLPYSGSGISNNSAVMFYYDYPEHDVAVTSISAPKTGNINEYLQITGYVRNQGLNDETDVNVSLKINSNTVNWTLMNINAFQQQGIIFDWKPTTSNNFTVEIYAEPVMGETNTVDNRKVKGIDVRNWKYVLLDRSNGGWGIYNFEDWVEELLKFNFIVKESYSGSITSSKLQGYDILLIPSPYSSFSSSELSAIQNYLNSGHGMFVLGRYDWDMAIYNQLTQPYEITFESYDGSSGTTTNVVPHEITTGVTSIYVSWLYTQLKVTGAAKGLVYDTSTTPNGIVFAISNESMPGRIAAYTDLYGFRDSYINRANNKVLSVQIMEWLLGDSKPPAKPKGFKATDGKVGNQVNLSWRANDEKDINGYFIYRSEVSSPSNWGEPIAKVTVNDTSYKDKGLVDGKEYYYVIAAVDEVPNISQFTTEKKAIPTDVIAPSIPKNFTITDSGTGFALLLTWNKNPEQDVTTYLLYKSMNVDAPFDVANYTFTPDNTTFLDTDVIEGMSYYYRLSAIDEVPNESRKTYVKSGKPYDRIAPLMPTGFNVTDPGLGNTLSLTWDHNQEDDLADYQIIRRDDKGNVKTITIQAPANSYNDTELIDGKKYQYRLFARDDSKLIPPNKSPGTPWYSGIPSDTTPPMIPQNFSINDESYSTGLENIQILNLSWNIGNDSDLRGYKIYKFDFPMFKISEDKLIAKLNVVNHFKDRNVEEGLKYYYKITAFDEVPNESPPSLEQDAIPRDVTPPQVPKGFTAEARAEGNAVMLTWELQIGTDTEGYRLLYKKNQTGDFELVKEFDKSENEFIHTGLIDDQIYYYKFQSFDAAPNYSPFTPVLSVTPSDIQPPSSPKGVRIEHIDTGDALKISWKPNEEDDINGYRVYRRLEDQPFDLVHAVDNNTIEVVDSFLISGKLYRYYVTALDEVPNESERSVIRDATPKDSVAPDPPSSPQVVVSKDNNGIVITWVPSESHDVEAYRIFRSMDGKNYRKLADVLYTKNSYTDTEVIEGKKYYYQVSAIDEVPNISPRTPPLKIEYPVKESKLDTSFMTYLIPLIILIIVLLIIALVVRKKPSKKPVKKAAEPSKPSTTKPPTQPPLPYAKAMPGVPLPGQPQTITQPKGPITPHVMTPTTIPTTPTTSAQLPSQQIRPEMRTTPLTLATTSTPQLPPGTSTIPASPEPEHEQEPEPGLEHEPGIKPEEPEEIPMEEEPELDAITAGELEQELKPVELEIIEPTEEQPAPQVPPPVPPPAPQPITPQQVTTQPVRPQPMQRVPTRITPISPGRYILVQRPQPPLPTILVPIDEYEESMEKEKGKKRRKYPKTILNPLLRNLPPVKLNQPPEGIVIKEEKEELKEPTEDHEPQKKGEPTKSKKTKKSKQKKKDSDDIKKILEEYMK